MTTHGVLTISRNSVPSLGLIIYHLLPELKYKSSNWSFTASCVSPSLLSYALPGRWAGSDQNPFLPELGLSLTSPAELELYDLSAIYPIVGILPTLVQKKFIEFLSNTLESLLTLLQCLPAIYLLSSLTWHCSSFMTWFCLGLQLHLSPLLTSCFVPRNMCLPMQLPPCSACNMGLFELTGFAPPVPMLNMLLVVLFYSFLLASPFPLMHCASLMPPQHSYWLSPLLVSFLWSSPGWASNYVSSSLPQLSALNFLHCLVTVFLYFCFPL